jgi:integrase
MVGEPLRLGNPSIHDLTETDIGRVIVARRKQGVRDKSIKDLRLLLETATKGSDPRIYGIVLIAAHSGCRSGEILHLTWADTDPVAR